jgi:hypothetical protein
LLAAFWGVTLTPVLSTEGNSAGQAEASAFSYWEGGWNTSQFATSLIGVKGTDHFWQRVYVIAGGPRFLWV